VSEADPYASSSGPAERPRHVLVLANETVAGRSVLEALRGRAAGGPIRVTVVCPQNEPRAGFVVYEDSRRSAAERRLHRMLELLHEAGIAARGAVVDPDPLQALKDAVYQYRPDEVIISTHPAERSGWLRGKLVERARKALEVPVEHVVVDLESAREREHVLVLANQTMVGGPLLEAIRERAQTGPAEFTLIAPAETAGAEERLAKALAIVRETGIEASGHIGDQDPVTAALNAVHDEQVDEIIVSTLPEATSGWLRRQVVERIRDETKLPVTHVVVEPRETAA
jgi:predicted metal-dependent hydrolase